MKFLPLTNSDKLALIDDEDYEKCLTFKWKLHPDGYATPTTHKERGLFLHRYILDLTKKDKCNVDHQNRNKLDCQKSNLIKANQTINLFNASIRSDNKTGEKGVSWDKLHNKYRAQGRLKNGRAKYIGLFETILEATNARKLFMAKEWPEITNI